MRRKIDAHVHITPTSPVGMKNERFETEVLPYGKLKKGEKVLQKLPITFRDSRFDVDDLIAFMDHYGIEKAVIQQSLLNEQNEVVAMAVEKYPDRLKGSMIVEPKEGWKETMHWYYARGLHSLKYEMEAYCDPLAYPNARLNDAMHKEILDEAERLGMTVVVDPARIDFPFYDPEGIYEAIAAHPGSTFVLCHLGFPMPLREPEQKEAWEKMIRCAQLENCIVELSAMPALFAYEAFPYPTMQKLLKQVKEQYGAKKFLWGSDIPGLLNFATYEEMQMIFETRGLFTEEELDWIFYGNTCAVYGF